MAVRVEDRGDVRVVTIDRPEVRNAVDGPTAQLLYDAFVDFDADDEVSVAVLTGASGTFCAGADLKAIADGRGNSVHDEPPNAIVGSLGPMGPTRLPARQAGDRCSGGHAVAGGLELAVWAICASPAADAVFGVYCRRWGVPLVDGGTVRLPRLDRALAGARPDPHRPRRRRGRGGTDRLGEPGGRSRTRPRCCCRTRRPVGCAPADLSAIRPRVVPRPVVVRPRRRAHPRDPPRSGNDRLRRDPRRSDALRPRRRPSRSVRLTAGMIHPPEFVSRFG